MSGVSGGVKHGPPGGSSTPSSPSILVARSTTPDRRAAHDSVMDTRAAAARAADTIRRRSGREPEIGLICGTGFGPCADVLEDRVTIPFEDLGFRPSAIPSHINEVD